MAGLKRPPVERQLRSARSRLFSQIVLRSVLHAWTLAFLASAFWFLLRPIVFAHLDESYHWGIPAALLLLATCVAIGLALRRIPSRTETALAIDDRFHLQERVTTLVTLSPEQSQSPAGLVLREDVEARVGPLSIPSRFSWGVSSSHAIAPFVMLLLVGLAYFIDPILGNLRFGPSVSPVVNAQDTRKIQEQLDNLHKAAFKSTNEPKSEDLKKLDEAMEKLFDKPLDLNNLDKVRERLSEMRQMQEKAKDRLDQQKEKAEKNDQLKKELEKLNAGDRKRKDGPAQNFEDALSKGEFKKAVDILEKLQKNLKDKKLTPEEKIALAEDLRKTRDKLEKLLEDNEQLKKMKDLAEEAKKNNDEELERDLEKQMQAFKDLEDLANALNECAGGLEGNADSEELERLIARIKAIALSEEEFKSWCERCKALEDEMKLLGRCKGNGQNAGGPPGAERPIDPDDPKTDPALERQKAEVDPKGKQRVTGFVRGGTFSKIPSRAVEGAFQRAEQEAPEAIDRQRIPDDAADLARGYFRKLGNQKAD